MQRILTQLNAMESYQDELHLREARLKHEIKYHIQSKLEMKLEQEKQLATLRTHNSTLAQHVHNVQAKLEAVQQQHNTTSSVYQSKIRAQQIEILQLRQQLSEQGEIPTEIDHAAIHPMSTARAVNKPKMKNIEVISNVPSGKIMKNAASMDTLEHEPKQSHLVAKYTKYFPSACCIDESSGSNSILAALERIEQCLSPKSIRQDAPTVAIRPSSSASYS